MPVKPALLMVGYAVILVGGGLAAYSLAPDGARAETAVIVTGAMAVLMVLCAVLALRLPKDRKKGMMGIHLGLVLPILFGLLLIFQGVNSTRTTMEYRAAVREFDREVETEYKERRRVWLEERDLPEHDRAYQAVTMWMLALASFAAFGVLLSMRSKPDEGDKGSDA